MNKNLVWSNDADEVYDQILKDSVVYEELVGEPMPEDISQVDDTVIWQAAYDDVQRQFEDEQANLDIDLPGEIFLVGTIERWNGKYGAYKPLGTANIGQALSRACASFDGDNSFEIYVTGSKLILEQRGHDNPVNPSVVEFRALKNGDMDAFTASHVDTTANLKRNSLSLGKRVGEVYGW